MEEKKLDKNFVDVKGAAMIHYINDIEWLKRALTSPERYDLKMIHDMAYELLTGLNKDVKDIVAVLDEFQKENKA